MNFHFHPSVHIEEERYGNAILTHFPMQLVQAAALHGLASKPQLEPRGALWVSINVQGTNIQVINTHLGLSARERMAQTKALLGEEWLADVEGDYRQLHKIIYRVRLHPISQC